MKISKKCKIEFILTLTFLFFIYVVNAQFGVIPATFGGGVRTATANEAISVGFVPPIAGGPVALDLIRARLHINSFYMPPSSALTPISAGDLFRTDATPTAETFSWRTQAQPKKISLKALQLELAPERPLITRPPFGQAVAFLLQLA